jgi:hypothetical protein
VYLRAGQEEEKTALLCVVGLNEQGDRELLVMVPGYRARAWGSLPTSFGPQVERAMQSNRWLAQDLAQAHHRLLRIAQCLRYLPSGFPAPQPHRVVA